MRKLSQLSGESTVVKEVPANNSARASRYVVWFSKAKVRNGTFYLIQVGEQYLNAALILPRFVHHSFLLLHVTEATAIYAFVYTINIID